MRVAPLQLVTALGLVASTAAAQTIIVAEGGTHDELQGAIDALGGPGVVVIPAGQWELYGTVEISFDDVVIIGGGMVNTTLGRTAPSAAEFAADPGLYRGPYFAAQSVSGLRVSGISFQGWTAGADDQREQGVSLTAVHDFRVDRCLFNRTDNEAVGSRGGGTGVVDHCSFTNIFTPAVDNYGYGVSVAGDESYSGLDYGSADAVFIEDNRFDGTRHAATAGRGARYVFRYNHVTGNQNSDTVDAHGDEFNGNSDVGTEWIEVYHNVIEAPVYAGAAVVIRGGKGVMWANQVNGYTYGMRLKEETPQPTGPVHLWGNLWGPSVVDDVNVFSGSPEYYTSELGSYTPYVYPHPLVTDLDVLAGPDMVAAVNAEGVAAVYVNGTGTTADAGSVSGYRWIEDGDQVLSSCARDVLELPEGQHLLLLEAVRDDGWTEYDTALIEIEPAGPLVSTDRWASRWFVPLIGPGTVSFAMTPDQNAQNAYVAVVGRHGVSAHEHNPILIRTDSDGQFDAYDGDQYRAVNAVGYQAGQSYDVVVTIDFDAQQYSATIDGTSVAEGFAFRRAESALGQITAWHTVGGLTVSELSIAGAQAEPDEACQGGEPDGGVGGSGGVGAGGGGSSTAPGGVASDEDGGCGCTVPGGRGHGAALLLGGLGLWGLRRRRRQRGHRNGDERERPGPVRRARARRAAQLECSRWGLVAERRRQDHLLALQTQRRAWRVGHLARASQRPVGSDRGDAGSYRRLRRPSRTSRGLWRRCGSAVRFVAPGEELAIH